MKRTGSTRRMRRLILPVVLTALAGCARHHAETDISDTGPTVLQFNNESLAQADVYVGAPGSAARRIGTVMSGRQEELVVPRDIAIRGNITVFARLLARTGVPTTGSIAVSPGTHLNVRLPLDERSLYVLPATS